MARTRHENTIETPVEEVAAVEEKGVAPEKSEPRGDESIPGGVYMRGTLVKDGKHYGGNISNAEGEVLHTFKPDEENTGKDHPVARKLAQKS